MPDAAWVISRQATPPPSRGETVSATDTDPTEIAKWDPGLTERVMGLVRPIAKRWFRSEVRGLDSFHPVERWWCPTTPAA